MSLNRKARIEIPIDDPLERNLSLVIEAIKLTGEELNVIVKGKSSHFSAIFDLLINSFHYCAVLKPDCFSFELDFLFPDITGIREDILQRIENCKSLNEHILSEFDNTPEILKSSEENKSIEILKGPDNVIGGTFDYLHNGHKILLISAALLSTNSLTIGLTSDELLVNKKNKGFIQNFEFRKASLLRFYRKLSPKLQIRIEKLTEPAGPTAVEFFDYLIVTEETASGAVYINELREKSGLEKLKVVTLDIIKNPKMKDSKLSSSEIRDILSEKCSIDDYSYLYETFISSFKNSKEILETLEKYFYKLVLLYSEPTRYYHTLKHILQMLKSFDQILEDEKNLKVEEIRTSTFFHDAIYNPRSSTNEKVGMM